MSQSKVCGGRNDSQYVVKNDAYDDLVSFLRDSTARRTRCGWQRITPPHRIDTQEDKATPRPILSPGENGGVVIVLLTANQA
ncbi:hypothetical protein REF28_09705 [Serratia marcescens]|uniref:hypothetical protein n=1 Tax=Serratia marcescens TaxID=615 RepID=UPI0021B5F904|nr:hypothetical protein [Serratia marcescens]